MSYCSLCEITSDDTELFFITKHGSPRHICPDCAALYEAATRNQNPDEAEAALESLYSKASHIRDIHVLEMLSHTLSEAKSRIAAIRDGSYDFALDEEETGEDCLTEVPEELRQDPEEAAREAAEEEAKKTPTLFDHILNWFWIVAGIVAGGVVLYSIIKMFL